MTDITFVRVVFSLHRADHNLAVRYVTRLRIDSCAFLGTGLYISGPTQDVRVENSLFLGSGGDCAIFFPTGYTSDVLIRNNTVDHLRPFNESTFPGRLVVVQSFVGAERLVIAGNVNRRAGPGALCDQNDGEQILFETASYSGAAVTAAAAGNRLSVRWREDAPRELIASRYRGQGGLPELWPVRTEGLPAAVSTVTINRGTGAGQTRRVVGIGADDETLLLDRPFVVQPDAQSGVTLSQGLATDVIVRDNLFLGIAEHVDSPAHVAVVLGFLWGNSHRFTYLANRGVSLRAGISLMPSNNATQTDSIYRDTDIRHTRVGAGAVEGLNSGFQPHYGVGVRNLTLSKVVGTGISLAFSAQPCVGAPSGLAVFEDVVMVSAAAAMAVQTADTSKCHIQTVRNSNMHFAGIIAKRIRAHGNGSGVGITSDDPMTSTWIRSTEVLGFGADVGNKTSAHGGGQHATPAPHLMLLTPAAVATSTAGTSRVVFANAGLADGTVKLLEIDKSLSIVGGAKQWAAPKMGDTLEFHLQGSGCGVLSDGWTGNRSFCAAPVD